MRTLPGRVLIGTSAGGRGGTSASRRHGARERPCTFGLSLEVAFDLGHQRREADL
jgi:hypothetical protein